MGGGRLMADCRHSGPGWFAFLLVGGILFSDDYSSELAERRLAESRLAANAAVQQANFEAVTQLLTQPARKRR